MAVELYGNGGETTLAAGVDSIETTLTVASASGFPTGPGRYRIRVYDELMIVTNGLGTTTWTVTRGAEGSAAASHTLGATVRHVLTAGAMPASLHASRSFHAAAAGNDTLTLGATPYQESLQVFINGALKRPGTDYTVSDKVVTFTPALADAAIVSDYYWTTTLAPADSVLSTAPPPPADTYESLILSDSPILYYRLGEASGTVAADKSTNNLAGAYVNTPTLGSVGLIAGDTDTSVSVSAASSQHVNSATSSLVQASNLMIEVWLKSISGGVNVRDETGAAGWFINTGGTNVALRISGTDYTTTIESTVLRDGLKHHVVFGADAATVYLYVDGAASWSAARSGTTAPVAPWHLARNGTTTQYTNGNFDEWAFYSSLTATQVSAHYTKGA